jgi:hypothetical protein
MNAQNRSTPSLFTQIATSLWMGTAIFLALLLVANIFASLVFVNRIFPAFR